MRHERGTLLVAILPLAVMVGGFVLLSTATARTYLDEHQARRHQTTATNEASAALAQAMARARTSGYTNNSNDLLRTSAEDGEDTGFVNAEDNPVKVLLVRDTSEVWVSRLRDGWYQLDAVASQGGRRTHVRTLVRERDPFSRFGAFVNRHPLGIAGAPRGDIHTNRVLQLFFPNGYYQDPVTSRDGFEWLVNANWNNTKFPGGYNDDADEITMPTVNSIQALSEYSDGALAALLGSNPASNYNIQVLLKGNTYDLVAVPKGSGATLTANDLPYPEDGVIYVDGDIASLRGELDSRVTVACTGKVTITGSLRYVDGNGDPIYLNGLSQDPANNPYVPNPDYDGNAVLGVIANGDILYSKSVPDWMEINGTFFSATGRYGLPGLKFTSDGRYVTSYDSTFRKKGYRRLGGIVTDLRIVSTVVNGQGQVLSGFDNGTSVFDQRLRSEPPPHFLAVNRPLFSAYRIVSGGDPGVESREEAPFDLNERPVGAHERENWSY